MKYKSELIKDIVDTRGHEKSSLHYESECVETWIKEAKGAYPKLCDYESEWLNYISTLDDTGGEFPYETITDVTEATVNNVVPYAYKSAVLKGQTLVNMFQFKETYSSLNNIGSYLYSDNKIIVVGNGEGGGYAKTDITVNLEANKTYTFKGNCDKGFNDDNGFVYLLLNNSSSKATRITTGNKTFQIKESGVYYVRLDIKDSSQSYIFSDLMILEGDYTNVDIPYFEGMQSVQMPVLTTTGKNLFDGMLEQGWLGDSSGNPNTSNDGVHSPNYIRVNPSTTYICSWKTKPSSSVFKAYFYDKNKMFLKQAKQSYIFTTPHDCYYVRFRFFGDSQKPSDFENIQIEEGTSVT